MKKFTEVKSDMVTGRVLRVCVLDIGRVLDIGLGLTTPVSRSRVIGVGIKRMRNRKKKSIFENMIFDFVTDL